MTRQVHFYYDVGSPTAYLAFHRLPAVAKRCQAEIRCRPVLLGGIFKAVGTHSPVENPTKAAWMWQDLKLFADRDGLPLNVNPHFPVNTLTVMRGAIVAEQAGELNAYARVVFDAIWRDGEDMADPKVIVRVLDANGFDPGRYVAGVQDPQVKERLKANTEEAVGRGVFGVPTFFVGDRMFFGQDRLDFVEAALTE